MLGAFAMHGSDVTREYPLSPVPRTKGSFGPWHVTSAAELGTSFEPEDDAAGVHAVVGTRDLRLTEGLCGEVIIGLITENDCETFCWDSWDLSVFHANFKL